MSAEAAKEEQHDTAMRVLVERIPGVRYARLILNRPERRNALDPDLADAFLNAVDELEADPSVCLVILMGAGGCFSSGMDLHYLSKNPSTLRPWSQPSILIRMMERMRSSSLVFLAGVQGYALGGGLALMGACDLAIAAESARIGMPEIIRGSFGQVATASLFHAGIPMKRAFWMQLTGETIDGPEAERWGLVSKSVTDIDFMKALDAAAQLISGHEPVALEHGKIAAYMTRDMEYAKALRLDELVGSRMQLRTDPFADLGAYLESQKGGGQPSYRRGE